MNLLFPFLKNYDYFFPAGNLNEGNWKDPSRLPVIILRDIFFFVLEEFSQHVDDFVNAEKSCSLCDRYVPYPIGEMTSMHSEKSSNYTGRGFLLPDLAAIHPIMLKKPMARAGY